MSAAKRTDTPSLIIVHTNIAHGTAKEGKASAHGEPLGEENIVKMKEFYGWTEDTFVVPEDVAAVLPDVCAHRLVMSAKARLHEYTPESALSELLQEITPPAVREFAP